MRTRSDPGVIDLALIDQDLAPTWQQDAECVQHAEKVDFFPARGESVREAKAVCARCPVRDDCLEFALRLKVAHGVWGGMSERERRSLRRDRYRAALSTGPAER
jgi:WhiB family redox-sensing transcriptional regulator